MSDKRQYDAILIGAGPSGSSAAALLAEHGHNVLLIEREKFPRYHIGESMMVVRHSTDNKLAEATVVAWSCSTAPHANPMAYVLKLAGEELQHRSRPDRHAGITVKRGRVDHPELRDFFSRPVRHAGKAEYKSETSGWEYRAFRIPFIGGASGSILYRLRRPQSYVISPFSTRVASGTRFWALPG